MNPASLAVLRFPRIFLAGTAPFLAIFAAGVAAATFEDRAGWMLENLQSQEMRVQPTVGRADVGAAAARLHADPQDAEALAYVSAVRSAGQPAFNMSLLANAYLRFQEHFSTARRNTIKAEVSAVPNWNEDYTENHRILLWSSLYLFAQHFPDATWKWEEAGEILTLDSAEALQRVRTELLSYGRSLFEMGHNEFLSTNYEGFKISAWLNLRDLAEDEEMRIVAEAALLYHSTLLAHASFEEIMMPPYSRNIGRPLDRTISAASQWTLWILWGVGNRSADARREDPDFFLALSDWRPDPALAAIIRGEIDRPYTFLAEQPAFFSRERGYMRRTTYREPRFAVSSGVYRFDPEDLTIPGARQLIDDAQFMIVWDSTRQHRQIMAGDPYWRSASGLGWGDASSPFMQTAQHDNTAIMLFDIPGGDPWPDLEQWSGERAETPLPLAQVRFPWAATYHLPENGWSFVEDGGVYIAIHSLRPGARYSRREMMDIGYATLTSSGTEGERWQTGFVFEIATDDDFHSFEEFRQTVLESAPEVDWETWTVRYTGTRGHTLEVVYNTSLEPPDLAVPDVFVDGTAIDFTDWPVMESPFVSLENHTLRLLRDDDVLVADWSGDFPIFTTTTPGFDDWTRFVGSIPRGERQPTDRHGPLRISNLEAYAMGMDPASATSADLPRFERGADPGTPPRLLYRVRTGMPDVSLGIETAADLTQWGEPNIIAENVLWAEDGVEQREVIFASGEEDSLFSRISLSLQPAVD